MKNRRWLWTIGALSLSFSVWADGVVSSTATTPTAAIADWATVQAAGGIAVDSPVPQGTSHWKLPLRCDMATHAPGTLIQKTIVDQQGLDIYISLVLGQTVWTLTPERSQCKAITLESTEGIHVVAYRDATGHVYPIGDVKFSKVGSGPGG